jgi:heat shock protein HslJ
MAEIMRSTAFLLVVIALSAVLGCAPSEPRPAESPEVVAVAADGEGEEAVAVVAEESPERVPEPAELVGAWLLEDLGGRGVMDMVQTTIVFDDEGRVSGNGGCNRYTGSYTFEDGDLGFGPLAATKRMCPEAVMNQETGFFVALDEVERVAVDGPFLLISFAGSEMPLRFTRMESDAAE